MINPNVPGKIVRSAKIYFSISHISFLRLASTGHTVQDKI